MNFVGRYYIKGNTCSKVSAFDEFIFNEIVAFIFYLLLIKLSGWKQGFHNEELMEFEFKPI